MLISVIIPSYNVEDYISSCLDSVLNQSYKNIEIICVDDCSSDGTLSILESYVKKNPSIILLRNSSNKGAPYSRNLGMAQAKGEYIQFFDADDLLLPEKISHQVRLIERSGSKPDIVVGASDWQKADGNEWRRDTFTSNPWENIILTQMGDTCANLWKRSAVEAVNGWNEKLKSSQESDLLFRLMKNNARVIYDKESLTILRQRETGSINMTSPVDNLIRFIELRGEILDYSIKNKLVDEEIAERMYNVLLTSIRQLYSYNPPKGLELFTKIIPRSFPLSYESKLPWYYKLSYSIMGFNKAESFFRIFKKIIAK